MTTTIGRATAEDAPGIAQVQVRAWQEAYRGIVPDAHLAGLRAEERAARWREWLAREGTELFVARAGSGIRGFCSVGLSRDSDAGRGVLEISAIYVHPDHWRAGLGRALLDAALGAASRRGAPAVTLWVLEENGRARAFYEARGFRCDGVRKPLTLGGAELVEIRYRIGTSAPRAARSPAEG